MQKTCTAEKEKREQTANVAQLSGALVRDGPGKASDLVTDRLDIQLFGALEARRGNRPLPRARTRSVYWLLALLVLRHGRPLARPWLAGLLWPDSPDDASLANLRHALTNLRHIMGPEAARLSAPTPRSISLTLDGATVDVLEFDQAIKRGDPASLERAAELYRGPLLEDCQEEWVLPEREAREQALLQALESLARKALDRSEPETAERWLRRAGAIDPLRESSQRLLMEALAARGDPAAATQVYRDLRLLLRREINAAPAAETVALYDRIRAHAGPRATGPRSIQQPATPPICRVPHAVGDLIGREQQIREVRSRLGSARLMTLTGSGGVGKTRLAIAVAEDVVEHWADGVCFVDLAPVTDPALVLQTVASALDIRELPRESLRDTLGRYLQPRAMLVILDNCEHLVSECARLSEDLLALCPDLKILATSREALRIRGEVIWRVPSLQSPDREAMIRAEKEGGAALIGYEAVRLFAQRAAEARPDLILTSQDLCAAGEVCSRLDGIPLAIELAAARVKVLTVRQIASRLDGQLRLLTGGSRTALPRQQTLRATLDWSYYLLDDAEQRVLRRLSVFAAGCALPAAEAVCADFDPGSAECPAGATLGNRAIVSNTDILDLLTALVDKSLLVYEKHEDAGRYGLLESVRQYALERLSESGEDEQAREAHLAYFLNLAEEADARLYGHDIDVWLDRLEADHDNLREALELCCRQSCEPPKECGPKGSGSSPRPQQALRLAGALWRFWMIRGYLAEGQAWLKRALECPGGLEATRERAKALDVAGLLTSAQGDYASARVLHERSADTYGAIGDRRGRAASLMNVGSSAQKRGEFASARNYYDECLATFRSLDDKQGSAFVLNAIGRLAADQGEHEAAERWFEESLALFRELDNKAGIAFVLDGLVALSFQLGSIATKRALIEESLEIKRQLKDKRGVPYALLMLAAVSLDRGDYAEARSDYEQSLVLFRGLGEAPGAAYALFGLGATAAAEGDLAAANAAYCEGLAVHGQSGEYRQIAVTLGRLAHIALIQGQPGRAAQLLGAVEALREASGAAMYDTERQDHDRDLAIARDALSQEATEAARMAGRAMTVEQAVEFAMMRSLAS